MPPPLEHKKRVRLTDFGEPPMPRPRRTLVLPVGLGAWLASVAVAWGVHAGSIPVASWLEPSADRASARRPARPPARRFAEPAPPPALEPLAPREPVAVVETEPEPSPVPEATAPPLEDPAPIARSAEPAAAVARTEPLAPGSTEPPPPKSHPTPQAPSLSERPEPPASAGASSVGKSCEAAAAEYADEIAIGGPRGAADLSAGDYSAILNRGGWFAHCGVPASVTLDVCVAVQGGRARGVTVGTSPRHAAAERCVGRAAAGLGFPSHPRLDVVRTRFAGE